MEKINCKEIRLEAWGRLFGVNGWFWRIVGATILFGFVGQLVTFVATSIMVEGIFSKMLHGFLVIIFGSIGAYGGARVFLNCARSSDEGCIKAMFTGFKFPFTLIWLYLCFSLIISLLTILPIAAGVVMCIIADGAITTTRLIIGGAFGLIGITIGIFICYCYRFVFFLKVDNPEWGAIRCVRESARRMKGKKWQLLRLDCSYWLSFTIWLALVLVALGLFEVSYGASLLLTLIAIMVGYVVGYYFAIGSAIFYRTYIGEER